MVALNFEINSGMDIYQTELLVGLIIISKSSSELWYGNGSRWLQKLYADCIGYLAGWGDAVISEIDANGKLDEKNANY